MGKTIPRAEAIDLLSRNKLFALSEEEKEDLLYDMIVSDWEDAPGLLALPSGLWEEFLELEDTHAPVDPRFDEVLILSLIYEFVGVQNEYILSEISRLLPDVEEIDGTPERLIPCPCCGYETLGARGDSAICGVCWWCDDGQDNETADEVFGGPNSDLSLTRARVNYLGYGLSEPSRTDLGVLKEPEAKFRKGRDFVISDDKLKLAEPTTAWSTSIPSIN